MSLRNRIALAGGAVVLGALLVASLVLYPLIGARLHDQLDSSLARTVTDTPKILDRVKEKTATERAGPQNLTGLVSVGSTTLQFVLAPVVPGPTASFTPVTERDARVARLQEQAYFQNATFHGTAYRVYTAALPQANGSLVRIALPLSEAGTTLNRLRIMLITLTLAGGLAAAAVTRLAARRVLRPVAILTDTIEHVATTRELTSRVPARGGDEIARLAGSFNAMMSELSSSVSAQERLIADASHELRTPLTGLITDLDLLAEESTDPFTRELVTSAKDQAHRLHALVEGLLDLSRYGDASILCQDVRLDLLAAHALRRTAADHPQLRFSSATEPTFARADPDAVERAISNLLDNAAKWSPPGGTVHLTVAHGAVTIADEGPGIEPEDLPRIFDRFYRSPRARSQPGSGLGLAIVRQIAEAHGGSVTVEQSTQGTTMKLTLPKYDHD